MAASGLVAILFVDLMDSTELASEHVAVATDELRHAHFAQLAETIAATGGTVIKTTGDALMASYGGAADALAGAVAMQQAVERHNRRLEGRRLEMRVGVSAGDATFADGDWFGTPVIEASRLVAQAARGQILVSDVVCALVGSLSEFELRRLGTRQLKGFADPVAVCEVVWAPLTHELPDWAVPVVEARLSKVTRPLDEEARIRIIRELSAGIQTRKPPEGVDSVEAMSKLLAQSLDAFLKEAEALADNDGSMSIHDAHVVRARQGICEKHPWIPWPVC